MSKPLIIVESPTKVRTIKKYIENKYNVTSTYGHIRDLPPKEVGIDIENKFKPKYVNIEGKQKAIKSLKAAAANASDIYLAPDPDREGEAIAYHTAEILKKKGRQFYRILFHELTKKGILDAIGSPKELDHDKYDAQQARRILDRLVGYQVSPLLWEKVQRGLSAGRVQSVTVRIICERERAIQAFEPEEYWSVTAILEDNAPPSFEAKLVKKNGEKVKIPDEKTANAILADLSGVQFKVTRVMKKTIKRNPLPPFITSKLQQESIGKLRFTAKKTMMVAQQLYEGVDLGPSEPEGLITYMRTDSVRIADEAAQEALKLINERFGKQYVINKPRAFKNKNKAQDAHEAIRPTSVYNTPEKLAPHLSKDQLDLYTLIWKRFLASQMTQALIDQKTVSIGAGAFTFNVSGSTVKFPGFMTLYMSADTAEQEGKGKQMLPEFSEGDALKLIKLDPKQHFTQPPPRFSEASLVKELEENGIGRPSTYANILGTIRDKGYVDMVNRYFRPNELGFIVNDLLVASFPDIFDVEFTAKLEEDLDKIEAAEQDFIDVLSRFYKPFSDKLDFAKEGMISVRGVGFPTGLDCPDCGKEARVKVGKNGPFLSCDGYPDCTYSRDFTRDEKGNIQPVEPSQEIAEGEECEKCGKPMMVKHGRYGQFLACSGYPECKNTRSVNGGNGKTTGVKCPEDGCGGELVERKSKRGKVFYGCSKYPECSYALWDKPVDKECPECGAEFVVEKTTKKLGTFLKCVNKECDFQEQ
ncbi:MAG: type I DNA topoisomerase [Deltaproteobacteria bacterium]|nr:type I DNA topoisomerase [Deltaproteobacteria bacterium]MBW2219418.1 type I DNA topoisomerase [Deltaproteobacteria bacterium]